MLAGLAAGLATPALADAPPVSLRPQPRPSGRGTMQEAGAARKVKAAAVADLIAEAKLGGAVGFAVADARTGLLLETHDADRPMPPASTLKSVTSLYALDHLGGDFRFSTRLMATGPVRSGRIAGDLLLVGGGDPTLSTDHLGDMAAALKAQGIRGVDGRFAVWGGALPYLHAIDDDQPDYLGYNPAVSGLNLNFNRVNCEWKRVAGGYDIGMDARAERYVPRVASARVTISERETPIFSYSDTGGTENWTVARAALGKAGSRWLPVRRPEAYAGDVFQTLAAAQGIRLPAADVVNAVPEAGLMLTEHGSDSLRDVLRDMMKFSTNMTAEAVGMEASLRAGVRGGHDGSARAMTEWLRGRTGVQQAVFGDHSGLGPVSRISAAEMVQVLRLLGPGAGLRGLMKPHVFREETGKKDKLPFLVEAKTGTLNFVSALVGYVSLPDGTELVFAIYTGDVGRRDALPVAQREAPPGGAAWVGRSKRLQQRLIERWATVYGA